MDTTTLIDLSTPAKHNQSHPQQQQQQQAISQDFTPTLSRALAECFKRRKQSLLPDLSVIDEQQDSNYKQAFDTPESNLSGQFKWKELLQGTPVNGPSYLPLDKENQKTPACIQTSKLEHNPKGVKRPPSTPMTPSLLKQSVKRRALGDKSSNPPAVPFTPSQLGRWNTPKQQHVDDEEDSESSPMATPKSVLQMRTMLKNVSQKRIRKQFHTCKVEEDFRLEAAYDKWLAEQQLKDLQHLVEFMELERQFNC